MNYESALPSDISEGSVDEISCDFEYAQARRETVTRLWKVTYANEDDRHISTSGPCRLYEHVTWYDVVAKKELCRPPWDKSRGEEDEKVEGSWKYRGAGRIRFIQTLEEAFNGGMIRMEMIHDGTLNQLMCH